MKYALRRLNVLVDSRGRVSVLILVVMEYALRQDRFSLAGW